MKPSTNPSRLSTEERVDLLSVLKTRFEANTNRHERVSWADIEDRLDSHPEKLIALHEMERTGGEPDVIGRDGQTGEASAMGGELLSEEWYRTLQTLGEFETKTSSWVETPSGSSALSRYSVEANVTSPSTVASTRTSPRKVPPWMQGLGLRTISRGAVSV